jgi:hypothetical protein
MAIRPDIVEKVNMELGTIGRPHLILIAGEWIDTGCMAWPLPPESEGAMGLASDAMTLYVRIVSLLMKSEHPSEPLYAILQKHDPVRLHEILKSYEQGAEIEELLLKLHELVSPCKWTTVHGMQVLDLNDLTPDDPREGVNKIWWKVRELLKDEPVIVYRGNLGAETSVEVGFASLLVVAPTIDQFDILRIEHTDGANYGWDTEKIIEKLKEFDKEFGVDIVGASCCAVEFLLKQIPKGNEARKLGRRLLKLCPDINKAPTSFRRGRVALWWD